MSNAKTDLITVGDAWVDIGPGRGDAHPPWWPEGLYVQYWSALRALEAGLCPACAAEMRDRRQGRPWRRKVPTVYGVCPCQPNLGWAVGAATEKEVEARTAASVGVAVVRIIYWPAED